MVPDAILELSGESTMFTAYLQLPSRTARIQECVVILQKVGDKL